MSKDNGKDNCGFENRLWAATLPTGQADALPELFADIRCMIEEARVAVAATVNAGLSMLYWRVGKRINEEVLGHERAEYGKHIVATLSRQLSWSVRVLREKIGSMLYERTALSRKPEKLARMELEKRREEDQITPDLIFRDPSLLDFLGLKGAFQEKDLEAAILIWATRRLREYIVKGFVLDDERLKNLDQPFDCTRTARPEQPGGAVPDLCRGPGYAPHSHVHDRLDYKTGCLPVAQ